VISTGTSLFAISSLNLTKFEGKEMEVSRGGETFFSFTFYLGNGGRPLGGNRETEKERTQRFLNLHSESGID